MEQRSLGDDRRIEPGDLDRRLAEAKARANPKRDGLKREENRGWSIAIEFIGAILVGAFLGWLIDRWLGTAPFAMILFFVLGFGAGLRAVMRKSGEFDGTPDEDDKV